MVMDRMINKVEAAAEGRQRRRRRQLQAPQPPPSVAADQDSHDAALRVGMKRDGEHESAIRAVASVRKTSESPGGVAGPKGRPAKLTTHGSVDPCVNGPAPLFARGKMLSPGGGMKRRRWQMTDEYDRGMHVTPRSEREAVAAVVAAAVAGVADVAPSGIGADDAGGSGGRAGCVSTASASALAAPVEVGPNGWSAATAVQTTRRRGRPRVRPADGDDEDDGSAAGGSASTTGSTAADDAAAAADGAVDPAVIEEQWGGRWSEPRVLRAATRLALAGAKLGGPSLRRAVRELLRVDGFRMLRWLRRWREAALVADAGDPTAISDSAPGIWERSEPYGFSYRELLQSALTDASLSYTGFADGHVTDSSVSAIGTVALAADPADGTSTLWMPTTDASAVMHHGGETFTTTATGAAAAGIGTHDATRREIAIDAKPGKCTPPPLSGSTATSLGAAAAEELPPPPPPPPLLRSPAAVPNDDNVPRLWRKMYDNALALVMSGGSGGGPLQPLPATVGLTGVATDSEECARGVSAAASVPLDGAAGPSSSLQVLREMGPAQLLAHAALSHVIYTAAVAEAAAPEPLAAAQPAATPTPTPTPVTCAPRLPPAVAATVAGTLSEPIIRGADVAAAAAAAAAVAGTTREVPSGRNERPRLRALTDEDLMRSRPPPEKLREGGNGTAVRRASAPSPAAPPGPLDAGQSMPRVRLLGLTFSDSGVKSGTAVASSAATGATAATAVASMPSSRSDSEARGSPVGLAAAVPPIMCEPGTPLKSAACVIGDLGCTAAGAADGSVPRGALESRAAKGTSGQTGEEPPAPPAPDGAVFSRSTGIIVGRLGPQGERISSPASPPPPNPPIQAQPQRPLQQLQNPLQPLVEPSAPSAGSNPDRASAAGAAAASCAFPEGNRTPVPVGSAAAPSTMAASSQDLPSVAPAPSKPAADAPSASAPTPPQPPRRPPLQGSQNRGAVLPSFPGLTAKRKQRPVSSLPVAVCMACLEALPAEVEAGPCMATHGSEPAESAWCCEGPCRRGFHSSCVRPTKIDKYDVQIQAKTICAQCFRDAHPCSICGRDAADGSETSAGLVKCSLAACGRWYHGECAVAHPLTRVTAAGGSGGGSGGGGGGGSGRGRGRGRGGSAAITAAPPVATKFRCPLHTCAVCSGSGEGAAIMACVRCATAYHTKCKPQDAELLAKKLLLCPACCSSRTAGDSITRVQQHQGQQHLQGGGAKRPRL
ncbi:hypothetical protein VaNZ11_014128 [Volvox africanus]|uniref:PHD-type domain-containing protein n=1 Tax=Volvox africanus TaxID=51714 RepID=A0ABQ5SI97_9CHLO|nr:hypothetical protein VaNZ11_014128 [Volvox africanus]